MRHLLIIVFTLVATTTVRAQVDSLEIYYDDFNITYRTGGTPKNIIYRADYIIKVRKVEGIGRISDVTILNSIDNVSMDVV